ncbi:MAG: RNA methyltransferase [Cyanobacteria bacterium J06627_15]
MNSQVESKLAKERDLIAYLRQFMTPERHQRLETVLAQRTRYMTVVLEDIHITQNAGAVLRNCDCFGIQDVHIIESTTKFKLNLDVTRGCSKWLTLHRYNQQSGNTEQCIQTLKANGYRLVATTPHGQPLPLPELPVDKPLALWFGNEHDGLSPTALAAADMQVSIPMRGFSESLNVSVSAALCLQSLCNGGVGPEDHRIDPANPWPLSAEETHALRLHWYRQALPLSKQLEKQFWAGLEP